MEPSFDALVKLGGSMGQSSAQLMQFVQRMALVGGTSLMRQHISASLADAFESSRLSARYQIGYGQLDTHFEPQHILQTLVPEIMPK